MFRRIEELLESYRNTLKESGRETEIIAEILTKTLGIPVNKTQLKVSKGVLRAHISSVIKTELYMKKNEILETINKNGSVRISDIV